MDDDDLRSFVTALPKAELHVHLEGSIDAALALRLAARHGVRLPGDEGGIEGVRAAYRFADFAAFIRVYLALSRCLQTPEDLCEAVASLALRLRDGGVVHAEVTFTPMTHAARGVPLEVMREGLLAGRAAAAAIGVSIAYVFDIVRGFDDQAAPTLAFALALAERERAAVAGLGLAGPEAPDHPLDAVVPVFERARAAGLAALPHAGEFLGPASVRAAIDRLGATRIGHGVRAIEDAALVRELADRGVVLEVCPSSNVALGVHADLASHPLPALLDAGVAAVLATDDPALFGVELVDEYLRCAAAFGWDRATIERLTRRSLDAAVIDADTRAAWLGPRDGAGGDPN
ncbi:MAG: adenosine deaminase [Deltaproteobacteria bacterium]|nr:adenosine deaminase [Deltaproteobacteria bacterium]